MDRKIPKPWIALFFVAGMAWAAETDAEIVKDLDFFMSYDLVQEEAVVDPASDDEILAEEPAAAQPASQKSDGGSNP